MSLLDKLWDDTLAGPRPETGLSRLRKHSTFAVRPSSAKDEAMDVGKVRSYGEDPATEEAPRVTRSIMIRRPAGSSSPGNGTPPSSPAGSTPPVSPFSGSGGREWNRFRRKSSSDAYERGGGGGGGQVVGFGPRSPPPHHEV